MANRVKIRLMEERELGPDLKPINDFSIEVHVGSDEIECWLGSISNKEELMEVAGPENLIDNINENLSEDEQNIIFAALECNDYKYYIGYTEYQAINNEI